MLKAYHRAFQMKGEMGNFCKYDSPTLIVSDVGNKLPIHQKSAYTNDNHINVSSFSHSSHKKYDFPVFDEKSESNNENNENNNNNNTSFQLPDPYTMLERDDDVHVCVCGKRFGFWIRRHHCRYY
jgi:hypothetical protein